MPRGPVRGARTGPNPSEERRCSRGHVRVGFIGFCGSVPMEALPETSTTWAEGKAAVCSLPTPPDPGRLHSMSTPFAPLADQILDALLAADPSLAGSAGDHRYDDRLPDFSPESVAAQVGMLRDASAALSGADDEVMDEQARVDHATLSTVVDKTLFDLTEIREHEWNPLVYNPGGLFHELLSREFAPAEARLGSLAGRLAAVPDRLATARAVLRDCPRVHLETAVGQFGGAAAFLRDQLPTELERAPSMRSQLEPLARTAIEELESFADWARAALERGEPGRDPRLGRRLWEGRLWHTLD